MTSQHVYNLDLDEIGENDNSVAVVPNTEVLASIAKQLSPFQSTFEIFRENQKWAESIRNNLVFNVSEIAKRVTMPTESLMEAFRSLIKPTEQLREQIVEIFKSSRIISIPHFELPTLDIPEYTYDDTYTVTVPPTLDVELETEPVIIERSKVKRLVKLPKNPKWQYLELIITSDRSLTVCYRGKKVTELDCKDLGMARMSTSAKQPDKQFILLYHIALMLHVKNASLRPTIDVLTKREGVKHTTPEKQNNLLYQTKRLLSKQLKKAFGIDEEPIDYDLEKGYQPKFILKYIGDGPDSLYEELPDPNTRETPESLKAYQLPLE